MIVQEVTKEGLNRINQYRQAKQGTIYLLSNGSKYLGNSDGIASYIGKTPDGSIEEVKDASKKIDIEQERTLNDILVPAYLISKNIVAKEAIYKYDIVTADGTRANSNIVSKRNHTYGMAVDNIQVGGEGLVVQIGDIFNPDWFFTVGSLVFLNGDAFGFTAPSTGFQQMIGKVIHPNVISICIHQAVLL